LHNLSDPWFFDHYRRNSYVLATGWDDQCLGQNQRLDAIMSWKEVPHKLFVWDTFNSHDWPTWMRMVDHYL
jgi:esterase/lipase superfamily enzyme